VEKSPLIALEIVLGFVAPLGWAFWELWSLRRERRRDLPRRGSASRRRVRVRTGAMAEGC